MAPSRLSNVCDDHMVGYLRKIALLEYLKKIMQTADLGLHTALVLYSTNMGEDGTKQHKEEISKYRL
ncbi:hypothetical protein VNO77_20220 [Canavalia gladiata]|uniref:Uncharacterized protein n=1 Tax=Canavalia gladiata TaxID=3824 RepID=A0AAN9QM80_CANGL